MASLAEHYCFSASCSHNFDPEWLFAPSVFFQIFESTNMMHLNFGGFTGDSTLFARLRE